MPHPPRTHRATLRLLSALLILPLILPLAGCDRGPSGPGSWEGRLEGPATAGAAFLVISGEGIEGVEGVGGTFLFMNEAPEERSARVVVVGDPGGGPLTFRVQVRDRSTGVPTGAVVELFDQENQRIQDVAPWRVEFRP
jgi:hypothetical protein